MVGHPNRSKRQGPRCLNCGDPIARRTEYVCAPKVPGSFHPVRGWTYQGNKIVTAKRYQDVRLSGGEMDVARGEEPPPLVTERRLDGVYTWDGESYAPTAGYFCGGPCAQAFAKLAASAGFRRTAT